MADSTERSKRYENIKLALGLADFAVSFGFLAVSLLWGWNGLLAEAVRRVVQNAYLAFLAFAGVYGLALGILTFPFDFLSGFVVEHQFGLSNQTFRAWLWEKTKSNAVGLVIALPLALGFYALLRWSPNFWWAWLAGLIFVFSVVLAQLAPVLIFPLFYKFEPLEDQTLAGRIKQLAQQVGLTVSAVFRFNLSKSTKKANAAFAGLGKTKRVLLADTLLDNFSPAEIESVVAHELGHYAHRHILKGLIVGFVLTFFGLFVAAWIYRAAVAKMGYASLDQLEALPLLAIVLTLYGLVTMPVQNAVSRHFERQADRFAVTLTGYKEEFISALEKLAEQNLANRRPHPVVEFLFYSHPSIEKRIELVRSL